jgi:hypothetical protein
MSNDTLQTRPGHIEVDPTADGRVLLIAIGNDDDPDTWVLRLTPRMAARLAQRLLDVAYHLERP